MIKEQDLVYFRGRSALFSILRALNVGPGDEVAVQAYTCSAVYEAINATGAKPLWIDVEPRGVTTSPESLEVRLSERTRCVIVQHTFGIPANMRPLLETAGHLGLPLIEDCCHTLDATYGESQVGTMGAAAFYSFEWGKPLVCGVGGAAIANDAFLESQMRMGWSSITKPPVSRVARNELQYAGSRLMQSPRAFYALRNLYRFFSKVGMLEGTYHGIDEAASPQLAMAMAPPVRRRLRGALLTVPDLTRQARKISQIYASNLPETCDHVQFSPQANPSYSRFPFMVQDKERWLAKAREARVEVAGWYETPVHPLTSSDLRKVGYEEGDCPNAESATRSVISLPTGPSVQRRKLDRIIEFLRSNHHA